jgi:hypothetical protein
MDAPVAVSVFGLDLSAEPALPFLEGARSRPAGRRCALSIPSPGQALPWPAEAEMISDERTPGGEVIFQIERSAAGYRFSGPRYGEAVLAADGTTLAGAPGDGKLAGWQRLLIAQVLPFAAVLRGLEVLHASGVVIDDEAVALLGRSGAGKTSLAVALTRHDAGFLTDDVLSLERRGQRLIAHCGPPLAGLDRREVERLEGLGVPAVGPVIGGDGREVLVRISPRLSSAPLGAAFILDRRHDWPSRPRFEPVLAPPELLSATFNLLLLDGARLESLLEVCAITAAGRVERVSVGPSVDASALAAAILERLRGER